MLHRYVGPDATDSSRNWHGYTKCAECQSKRWESISKPELRENADIFDSKIIEKGRSQDTDETPIWPGKECKRVVDRLTSEAVRPQGIDSSHFVNSSPSFSNLRTWSPPPHHGLSLQQARSRYGPSKSKGKVAAKKGQLFRSFQSSFLICSNIRLPLKPKHPNVWLVWPLPLFPIHVTCFEISAHDFCSEEV